MCADHACTIGLELGTRVVVRAPTRHGPDTDTDTDTNTTRPSTPTLSLSLSLRWPTRARCRPHPSTTEQRAPPQSPPQPAVGYAGTGGCASPAPAAEPPAPLASAATTSHRDSTRASSRRHGLTARRSRSTPTRIRCADQRSSRPRPVPPASRPPRRRHPRRVRRPW